MDQLQSHEDQIVLKFILEELTTRLNIKCLRMVHRLAGLIWETI